MTTDQAEKWVVISAAVVAGVYGYRRVTEPDTGTLSLKRAVGLGNPLPLGAFVTAWGFTYLVVSILASANAGLGGSFAILIMAGDLLANAGPVFGDVRKYESASQASARNVVGGASLTGKGQANRNPAAGGAQIVAGTVQQQAGQIGLQTTRF